MKNILILLLVLSAETQVSLASTAVGSLDEYDISCPNGAIEYTYYDSQEGNRLADCGTKVILLRADGSQTVMDHVFNQGHDQFYNSKTFLVDAQAVHTKGEYTVNWILDGRQEIFYRMATASASTARPIEEKEITCFNKQGEDYFGGTLLVNVNLQNQMRHAVIMGGAAYGYVLTDPRFLKSFSNDSQHMSLSYKNDENGDVVNLMYDWIQNEGTATVKISNTGGMGNTLDIEANIKVLSQIECKIQDAPDYSNGEGGD